MDAIRPEFHLGPDEDGARCMLAEWHISEQPLLMFYRPTHLLFEIYCDPFAIATRASILELRSRLNHVCDGRTMPSEELARIGRSAIYAVSIMTEVHEFIEHDSSVDNDNIPF